MHLANLQTFTPNAAKPAPARADAPEVSKAVAHHARAIGCDSSNTQAAVAWALRSAGHTLLAVRDGRRRAEQLLVRQPKAIA